jgi:membrane-associated phospholipid phosphatase
MKKIIASVTGVLIFLFSLAQPFTSPYKLSLAVDVPLGTNALGLLGTSYLIGTSKQLPPKETLLNLNRNEINRFDRGATYQNSKIAGYASDATMYLAVALPLLHLINKDSRKDFGKIAAMTGEVFVLNMALTDLLKETVRRKRPLMYNPDIPLDKKYKADNFKSYFSGHTSTVASMSFFFAKTFADYNPHSRFKPMVWSFCAALPIVTGVLRYKAGKHYWTDIITGYAIGALVGIAVPYLHSIKLHGTR